MLNWYLSQTRSPNERKQIGIDRIFIGRAHAVVEAPIDLQCGILDELGVISAGETDKFRFHVSGTPETWKARF
jgi:hypothetical protein